MKRVKLTSEWLSSWNPTKQIEVADGVCRGLVVRGGPSGAKVFYRWTDEADLATGKKKRKRVRLATWAIEGGGGALSLGAAREAFIAAQQAARAEVDGTAETTVEDLAKAYQRDILARREPASAAWSWGIIKTHVLTAAPDPRRPPFGEWPARAVRPPDVAALIRAAKVQRTVGSRRVGGPGVARAALREVRAIFAAAVGAGSLEMSPAGVLQASALGLRGTKRGRYLDAAEVKALFEVLDLNALLAGSAEPMKLSATTRLGIALLLFVPVRTHSLIGAGWKEIDTKAKRWVIPVARQKMHRDARAEARPFTAPLCAAAAAILERLRELAGSSPFVLASPLPPSNPKEPPRPVGGKVLIRALARLQADGRLAAGAPFTIHDLRRTWRAWAGELGVSFEVAEKSLGHVLPGVADTYARAEMVEQRAAAAELVGAAFDRIRLGKAAKVTPIAAARGA